MPDPTAIQAFIARWQVVSGTTAGKLSTFWTPPKKYSLRALARAVGTTSVITIGGGPRSCWFNEQAKKVTGASLSECCGKYKPAKWHLTANGTIRCQPWQVNYTRVP